MTLESRLSEVCRVRIGEFQFDSVTGELVELDCDREPEDREAVQRLAPQPARLLQLLIQSHPDVCSREQIRQVLWPDTTVDYDQSLHFCIRQIRSALGDSAAAPVYVETIPRRGYRLIASVSELSMQPDEVGSADGAGQGGSQGTEPVETVPHTLTGDWVDRGNGQLMRVSNSLRGQRQIRWVVGLVLLSFAVALSWFAWSLMQAGTQPGELPVNGRHRVAIMPFAPPDESFAPFQSNAIAETLLDRLASSMPFLEIVGPTTTQAFTSSDALPKLIDQYQIDVVINGRFTHRDGHPQLLAEIIRANDGTHVWVQQFDSSADDQRVADAIVAGLQQQIIGPDAASPVDLPNLID